MDSWGTGWLGKDEALPSNLWANTTTAALQPLFADAKPLQLAPSAREALKRVALSAAKGPANGDALIPERLRIIEQLGFTQYSIELRKRFPNTEWGRLQERVAADYELVQGQSKSACARAADKKGNDEAWMSMRAFCFALANLRRCLRRRQNSLLTTKTTTKPFNAVTSAEGTCTILCMLFAPTNSAPNKIEAGMVRIGCNCPNKAATIPLKPALPVKPEDEPSVIMR